MSQHSQNQNAPNPTNTSQITNIKFQEKPTEQEIHSDSEGDTISHELTSTTPSESENKTVGSSPVLSLNGADGGKMNVSCQSHGWLPEPSITWTDKDGKDLKHLSKVKFTNNSEGFVDVSSWLIVSPSESEWISCSVGFSDQERKEGRIMLYVPGGVTGSLNGYFIVIPILLLLCAAGIAVFCVLRKKGLILSKRTRTENIEAGTPSESEPLNKSHVENQDQNDTPLITGSHAVVAGWSHLLIYTLPTHT
ncbi:hypothetical protein PDJAM_G00258820 [Pangasius djambal]|nr:hypothetical protein [Pangasius djambal]